MKRRVREDLKKTFIGSVGWLFADLLLVLAMLFLIANTISQPKLPVAHAEKPKAKPTVTVAPPRLEQAYHRFSITIDPNRLLNKDVNERNAVIQQVRAQKFLHNRNAGLVIVYGGAPTTADIGTATNIANTVYAILKDLGKHDATFARVSTYDPLYVLGGSLQMVNLDIFLFAQ